MKKKDVVLFAIIFLILLLISGGTYAYWTFNSQTSKNIVFNTSAGIEDIVVYDEGSSYFVGNFQPTDTYCGGINNTISFYRSTEGLTDSEIEEYNSINLSAVINMDVNSIGTNIRSSSDVYWVITSGDSTSCTGSLSDALNYGTFNGVSSGDVITLLSDVAVTTTEQQFTTWIWIDSTGSDLYLLSGETVDTNIWTQIDMADVDE